MTLVFDTSALSALLDGDDAVMRAVAAEAYDRMLIPLATDAEMRFGFANGKRQVENLANYELFKQQFNVEVVCPDQDTSALYAELATWTRQHGVALSHNDLWIAAATLLAGGKLVARDQDFARLPQLRLLTISATP